MNYPSTLLTVWFSAHFILRHGIISAQRLFAHDKYDSGKYTVSIIDGPVMATTTVMKTAMKKIVVSKMY